MATETQLQFVENQNGERTAVILPMDEYERLMKELEELKNRNGHRSAPPLSMGVAGESHEDASSGKAERRTNEYTAIIRKSGKWWIGWVEEVPAVICQESTRDELLETIKITLGEILEIYREEALLEAGEKYEREPIVV